ncbi:phosphoribosyltransferase family protein [Mycolicibacterium arenosum]|uniref:Phosphoribosyltransferase family protein n=1 Tax=Mycolicibacterium arenosum TaxID=2952157 RepID=A0ABT1M4M6_9MYCO|nr:phosphoribosyltransferase family protein [Mycolicibacterium sp. CAU 1645]MCP9274111.1 phosphoribosyltransferase family protein [Mycolicibacterium sp. CAU 1645]
MTAVRNAWATQVFGFEIIDVGGSEPATDLVLPGLRRNPRRAHLLVSTVLGKHIAVPPAAVVDAGHRLAACTREVLSDTAADVDVLGMAETATSLGHCVADGLDAATYIHTTRRDATPDRVYAAFQEGHSHATDHTVQPSGADVFDGARPLVIVDDEISTGTTALAAIAALHDVLPRPHYVVSSLVDLRTDAHRDRVRDAAAELGVPIDFVSLGTGRVVLPEGMTAAVNELAAPALNPTGARRGRHRRIAADWPATVPEGGRHGFLRTDRAPFDAAVDELAVRVGDALTPGQPVLVIGHEELMYLPLRLADSLTGRGFDTRFQTSTRSPAYVHDAPGYPLRTGFTFHPCERGEDGSRYMYNGWPGAQAVLVVDAVAATDRVEADGGIVDALTAAGYDVLVVVVGGPDADALARSR